ncbi:MarR family winged helix-turn-helix transcriptional regulator [Microbacterium deminutum]|uniref:MarR family transcriptional regulator n=1 Tax=Microbacterium deminutum TaxID=344164 RepID=A0ABN2RHU7_9MICO
MADEKSSPRLADTDLADEIEFLLARARSIGTSRANAALGAFNLKVREYSVLSLACSGLDPSQTELASFLRLDASQVVSIVDALEDRGLVVRARAEGDRRAKTIAATAAGRDLYTLAYEAARTEEARSLAPLTATERSQLRSLLRKVALGG